MARREDIFRAAFLGAAGFGAGALLVVLPIFVLPFGGLVGVFLVPLALMFGGGVIGGASLRTGTGTIIRCGITFMFSGFFVLLLSVAPQGMGGAFGRGSPPSGWATRSHLPPGERSSSPAQGSVGGPASSAYLASRSLEQSGACSSPDWFCRPTSY